MKLELLSPAKNLEQGRAAIKHGADAVYIGAPAFGARQAASNNISDIEQLSTFAHLYGAKVYVTLNTLLFDHELEQAVKMTFDLYNAGIDAFIVQDMALLECDLPPIALHASTQTHNATPEKVQFLEQVGFKRIILARECSLEQMQSIREHSNVELEAFVHGALCVSYSGQCYLSQYLSDRSGNRGCCSQPCRSRYDLYNENGKKLRHGEHLLSLRDFDASEHLRQMVSAGICSFKIEGRLKDTAYVCNLTAFYRRLLDSIIEESNGSLRVASSGSTLFSFTPDPERTFSRRRTDYFLQHRQPMASFGTQKALGKKLGKVTSITGNQIHIATDQQLSPGDGLCFFTADGKDIDGFLVNRVQANTIEPNRMPDLAVGTMLWRNNDIQFEKQFQGTTSERKIDVSFTFAECTDGFLLSVRDCDCVSVSVTLPGPHAVADNQQRAADILQSQLSKLGGTPFSLCDLHIEGFSGGLPFLPSATINQLRRDAVQSLIEARVKYFRPKPCPMPQPNDVAYTCGPTDFRLNIINRLSERFYRRHGVATIERGLEQTRDYTSKPLMTTKYCLRYELGQCLRCKTGAQVSDDYCANLYLVNNGRRFLLRFDCDACQMLLYACSPLSGVCSPSSGSDFL